MNLGSNPRTWRPLLMVEAANPEWTSVPLVGWKMARAIAQRTNAHMVTHVRNRAAILRAGLVEGTDFTAIDNECVAGPMYRLSDRLRGGAGKGWTTMMAFSSLAYYSFEREVWREFEARITAGEFHLVHRITPLSPSNQSLMAKKVAKAGIPFVVGPLNGGVPWPRNFTSRQYAEKEWLSHVRGFYKLMPAYRATRKYASAIIVASSHTFSEMPEWAKKKCILIPENGVDESQITARSNRANATPMRAIFVGRLVPYKGADMLIKAAAPFLLGDQLELEIVGDGPQRPDLEMLADELKVRNNIRFHGWLSHSDSLKKLSASDVMVLPSIREFGGGVVVEAMACGAAPIVANYAGPAELVNDETGIRVPFSDEASLIEGMRQAIGKLLASPQTLSSLSAAAQEKVRRELTWEAKADQILRLYKSVLQSRDN